MTTYIHLHWLLRIVFKTLWRDQACNCHRSQSEVRRKHDSWLNWNCHRSRCDVFGLTGRYAPRCMNLLSAYSSLYTLQVCTGVCQHLHLSLFCPDMCVRKVSHSVRLLGVPCVDTSIVHQHFVWTIGLSKVRLEIVLNLGVKLWSNLSFVTSLFLWVRLQSMRSYLFCVSSFTAISMSLCGPVMTKCPKSWHIKPVTVLLLTCLRRAPICVNTDRERILVYSL